MILAFPDLHPDELMYSGCARYTYRLGYPNLKSVMSDLFGSQQITASTTFSSHLDYFVTHQPYADRFTVESLIAEHTLLPFYAPFLPPERVKQLQTDMRGANGSGIYMRVGLMASTVPLLQHLRYCPDCAKEDQVRFGEKYWHRLHQIPGVSICHVHNVLLENSSIQRYNRKTRHQFIAAEDAIQSLDSYRPIDPSLTLFNIQLFLAKGAEWLLHQRNFLPGLTFLHSAYKKALINRDLAKYNGRMRMSELQEAFVSYYSDDVLSYFHCSLDRQSPDNWLARLVRKPDGSQHPLQHLLLIYFLGCAVETFFLNPSDYHPFGEGPWPCLNPVSNHYRQLQIEECKIVHSQYTNGKPVGTFSCACGFTYSRTGPDTSIADQFRFNKIKAFGQVWEMNLQTLWKDESLSLRGIARQLGVDSLTVKRHATRIGLPFPRSKGHSCPLKENQRLHPSMQKTSDLALLETYRITWLTMQQTNAEDSITKLRSKAPGVYSWLYRNDKVWLKEHLPMFATRTGSQRQLVDWEERDLQLAEEVKTAATHLKSLPGRPVHITTSAIGREIAQTALLQQHLDKLPRTADALAKYTESREAYAVRRVWAIAMDYRQKNICLERWQLVGQLAIALP